MVATSFSRLGIKLVVDVIHGLLPVIEPVIQGIVGLIKGIVSVTITVANAIIGTLNKLSFTVPDWVPALGGKQFGFNLKEVAMPAFANGGFTHGVSIAGEAGTEAVISFKPSVHDSNVENWVRAGRMLGVSGEDATRAAGVRCFANGGFTDGSKEKLDNLIDFSKAYGKYALRSNGIRTTGDALSMLWTVANNSMSGDASLALAATSLAADVAPLLLNKYLGSDSPVTTALTEAAKNYNGGTVLSSWQDGVLTDTGTPLYVLPPRDTGRTLSEIPVSAYPDHGQRRQGKYQSERYVHQERYQRHRDADHPAGRGRRHYRCRPSGDGQHPGRRHVQGRGHEQRKRPVAGLAGCHGRSQEGREHCVHQQHGGQRRSVQLPRFRQSRCIRNRRLHRSHQRRIPVRRENRAMVEWKKHDLPTLAEKEAAEKKQKEREQLLETVAALKAAQSDTDEMVVDQEYRITMLELGVSDTDDTDNADNT